MLSELDAKSIVTLAFPDDRIEPPIVYRGLYVFQVFSDDPVEGDHDPFFSVNQRTGELRDFSILTDGNTKEITDLFLAKQKTK